MAALTTTVALKNQGPRQRRQGPWPHCTADRWPWWSLGGGSAEGLEEGSWRRRAEVPLPARGAGGRVSDERSATITDRGSQPDTDVTMDC